MKDREIWMKKMAWKESIWEENCPFCKNEDKDLVVKNFKFWKLVKNLYPYNGIKNHLLLIPFRHIEHTKFLKSDELKELSEINEFIENYYSWENYFSFIRETNWGKSIKHIHFHYLPWILFSNLMEWAMKTQHELFKEKEKWKI